MCLVMSRNQLKKQFLEIVLLMLFTERFQRSFGQNLAAMDDRNPIAKFFYFAHDMRRKNDAFSLLAQFLDLSLIHI